MTDMTIALTFFFALVSMIGFMANSRTIVLARRLEKQKKMQSQIVEAFNNAIGNVRQDDITGSEPRLDIKDAVQNKLVGQVWQNGNFQRIMVFDGFDEASSTRISPLGRRIYMELAESIKNNAKQIAYLYVHGIVERYELAGKESRARALELSRQRADAVSELLRQKGLIAEPKIEATSTQLAAKYVITYGTGDDLYLSPRGNIGRVDLVLFFKDGEEVGGAAPTGK